MSEPKKRRWFLARIEVMTRYGPLASGAAISDDNSLEEGQHLLSRVRGIQQAIINFGVVFAQRNLEKDFPEGHGEIAVSFEEVPEELFLKSPEFQKPIPKGAFGFMPMKPKSLGAVDPVEAVVERVIEQNSEQ